MIVFCHAELLICATVLQHRLIIATVFLSFQIHDNDDDFSGTAQNGPMLMKEICPRGNNKVVILYFLTHDKCLLFMLELY